MKASVPFGGGLSRMRETCGAVSAIALVIGAIEGYITPETGDKKAEIYKNTQELLRKFEEMNGSLVCRELRNLNVKHESFEPSKRDENFYVTRPCTKLIGDAAEILDNYLKNKMVK